MKFQLGFPLFSDAKLEFLWWKFTMVFEKIVPIVLEFVCYPRWCCYKVVIKDGVELWRNISSFWYLEPEQHSLHAAAMYQYKRIVSIKMYILLSIYFEIFWDRGWSKAIQWYAFFTLAFPLVDEKCSNAVRPDSSWQLLPTSIANFIAYGHNYVVITSFQQIVAFKIMIWAWYVTVFIVRSEIMFWWCSQTSLKSMVWFAASLLSLKTLLLKAPFSAWYFWVFTQNFAAYCSSACFASTASFDAVLSLKFTSVNLGKWSTNIVATWYFLLVCFHLRTGINPSLWDSIWLIEL